MSAPPGDEVNSRARAISNDIGDAFAAELETVARSKEFAGSPVMLRLLRFLVAQTIAGTADSLKAYTIAVEGLGRPADFDPLADSYPRVQVGRLRKLLETYYARNADDAHLCLFIRHGNYRVRLARRMAAYPQLAPQKEAASEPLLPPPPPRASVEPEAAVIARQPLEMSVTLGRPFRLLGGLVGGAVLTATLVGVVIVANSVRNCPILPQITASAR